MKKTSVLVVTTLALASASVVPVHAGDREWAVAGKVLTGVVAAGVIAEAFRPAPVAPTTAVVYQAPPPTTVVYVPPAPVAPPAPVVVAAPAQVVYAPAPAPVVYYYAPPPPPTVVVAAPVCYRPAVVYPAVSVHMGFGYRGGHAHHRGWR